MPELSPIKPSEVRKHLRPGAGRIAVEVVKANQKWIGESGTELWIPDIAGTRTGDAHLGVVVAICEPYRKWSSDGGVETLQSEYPLGALVIFGKYTGTDVTVGREQFIIMFDSDVLAEWIGELPPEEQPRDTPAESDADLLRRHSSELHFAAPTSRGEGLLAALPPGLLDTQDEP